MEQSGIIRQAQDERRVIEALYRVNGFISAVTDLRQLLELIMRECKGVMDTDACSLMLYDQKTNQLYFEVAQGPKTTLLKTIRLNMNQGIAGACASERKTLVVQDVRRDERFFGGVDEQSTYQTRNILATPMVRGERLIGVLEVLNKNNNADFTDDDLRLIEFFGDQAAIAIENALLIHEKVEAERLAAVGVAVAGISHYIKNILAGIKGSASLIEHALKKSDLGLIEEAFPVFQRSTGKIQSLVQDMLTYSKRREPQWELGNLNLLLQDIRDMQRERAAGMNVELALELAPDLPDSEFDPQSMSDTVLNLTTNAIEACENLEGARVTLSSRYDAERGMMLLAVRDNGLGIPPEIQPQIFEPFFSTKGAKGTGLGLAVTRKVIEEHGGEIVLESEPGHTCFQLYLPAARPA